MNKILELINKLLIRLMIIPVRLYQVTLGVLLPNSCRHYPTCSQYAIEALKVHGIFKGSYLAIYRILRCNPWGTSGYDPVPPKKKSKQDQ